MDLSLKKDVQNGKVLFFQRFQYYVYAANFYQF